MSRTALFVPTCVLLAACHRTEAPAAPGEIAPGAVTAVAVRTAPVVTGPAAREVALRGVIEIAPGRHARVAPQTAGRLTAVTLREGDAVHAGDVLARVDTRMSQDAVTQAQAALAGADAAAQNAVTSANRTQDLLVHGISAQRDVDDANARVRTARAQVTAAQASLAIAQRNLSLATVRAPIDGVVLRVFHAAGDLVDGTPATAVMDVGDPTALELLANAAPSEIVKLTTGLTGRAHFGALPGREYTVTVRSIAPAIDPSTGVGAVHLALVLAPGDHPPPIGLAGEALVATGSEEAVNTVPSSALRASVGGTAEIVTCTDGHLHAKTVHIGPRANNRVEVLDGVATGERVVAADVLGLVDGAACTEAR